ncbi:chromosome segregation protein SMC [Fontisphaera persica]|uniref:chromosome segregation protein SMC n=1 Tax=Fontisphaera persica TaxID=2974023 RepID=UPI0024C0A675|nr:chromosome segregation protein SMC [Fontisphaera persica]WCJ60428.1 chromosome segregation protein SMC [Fontisphaera persica]
MYLKSLTVLGFKSFADKTTLNFLPGVTCIVGPNGCGKSNVSDAIRWVLGEQSAKALRGGEMADVIFNGTDTRKPLGMAEVSLTIGDVDAEQLRAAGVELSYNEVTITRRVFRDGGSEYFINRTPCRLKDIQQLFMGTGVGRASYSIMAQGSITQILSSRPEDRRMVFEEAAGITKFKAQKKEALRKLEYTEQNLLRVADLIKEVKRQIGSLQRQAGKARRYRQLMQELQHLDTQLARHQFDVLQGEIRERQARLAEVQRELEAGAEALLRQEDELAQLRQQVSELEQQISLAQQQGLEVKGQIERHENRIQFNQERIRELEQQNARALRDIAEAKERRQISESELEQVMERLREAEENLSRQRENLAARQQAVREVEDALRQRQEVLRQVQSETFAVAQKLARARNAMTALELQKQGNLARLEKLSAEKIQLEEERGRLERRLQEFAASVEEEKKNVLIQRGTVEERQRRLRETQQELAQVVSEVEDLLRQQAGLRARLNTLEQLAESHEGFGAGALAALKKTEAVLGSLADRIQTADDHVTAVEAALGHHLQLVLTDQPETARQIVEELRQQRKGKASVAALALRNGHHADPTEGDPAAPGQPLTQVIQADDLARPWVNALLGRTRLVPDLAAATAAWQQHPGQWDYVTPHGDLLSRHGIFSGGSSSNGSQAASILSRKNQIQSLRATLSGLQEKLNECNRRKGALQAEQTSLQSSLQQAQTELRAQEVSVATHQGEFNALQNSLRVLHQKIDTVVYEIQSLAGQAQEGQQQHAVLAAQAAEYEKQEQELQCRLAEESAGLEELRQQRELASAALTEAKVAVATQEQLRSACWQQKGPLEQRIRELGQLVSQREAELGTCAQRHAQAEAEIEDSRRQMERLAHEREQVNARTALLQQEKGSLAAVMHEREEHLRSERKRHSEMQQQKAALEVELAQKEMSVQNLRERIQQKYQVNLDDVRSECITITYADEGPARVETLTPEQMAAAGVATDWKAVAEQVAALQQRIEEMGPVNLVAIEEYEETEQRYKFLSAQHEDLVAAKAQLVEVIQRINSQTREMFTETFNKIRDNFQNMFVEIFGGGKADLRLVDEGDVLESGIEIVARPPGKQLQSISLLSGGEQTMTAVALLFSIYQVKPSPFCVLDELDAPLDESNINRFIKVLQRFLLHSQFIIITHNKRTIGMADVLYGITMQENGVSKVVSVKFHKADPLPSPALTQDTEAASPTAGPVDEAQAPQAPANTSGEVVLVK